MNAEQMQKVRKARLRLLIDKEADGNVTKFAQAKGMQQSHLSRYVASAGKSAKPIGERAARSLEESLGLDRGYLDATEGVDWLFIRQEATRAPAQPLAAPPAPVPRVEEPRAVLPQGGPNPLAAPAPRAASVAETLPAMLVAATTAVPKHRREVVATLISSLVRDPENGVFAQMLAEELEKHI